MPYDVCAYWESCKTTGQGLGGESVRKLSQLYKSHMFICVMVPAILWKLFFFDFLTAKLSVIQNRDRTFSSQNSIRKFKDCKRFKINK